MDRDSSAGQKTWYVSFLCDPDTQVPFYIGKGTGNRAEQHIRFINSLHNPAKKDANQCYLLAPAFQTVE